MQAELEERGLSDPTQLIDLAREHRDRAAQEAVAASDSEEAARRQGEAMAQRLALLATKLAEAEEERRAELAPELKAARDDVALLQGQLGWSARGRALRSGRPLRWLPSSRRCSKKWVP
ncbi:hypothetical protein ABPG77_000543 [Micractinium sp. CCAP 211/92]